jgi:predicted Zn-dependent protease
MGRASRGKAERHVAPEAAPAARRRWIVPGLAFLAGIAAVAVLLSTRHREPATAPPKPVSRAARPAEAQLHVDRARRHIEAQETAKAQAEIDEAQALAPRDPEVAFMSAELAYRTLQMEKAERQFRRVVELDPGSAAAFASLALVLLEEGQAQAAADAVGQAIALDPHDPGFTALLGKSLLRLGRPKEAADLLEQALAAGARGADRYANLGRARDLLGQTDAALRAFDEALRLDPRLPLAHFWRAECLRRAGRTREAERELEEYRRCQDRMERIFRLQLRLTQNPRDVPAWLELARLRVERGIPSQAMLAVLRAESLAGNDPEVRQVRDLVQHAAATTQDVEY